MSDEGIAESDNENEVGTLSKRLLADSIPRVEGVEHLIVTVTLAELRASDSQGSLAKSLGSLHLAVPSNCAQIPALKFRVRFLTCPIPLLSPST